MPSLQRDISWEAKLLGERREAKRIISDARSVNFFPEASHFFYIFLVVEMD